MGSEYSNIMGEKQDSKLWKIFMDYVKKRQ